MEGGTVSEITGGKFIMGIGSGAAYRPQARAMLGVGQMSALTLMRDYLTVVRSLVRGERVDYEGAATTLKGMRLAMRPAPNTPVYLGALGPRMLELSGELADGASLNWCSPEQIAWSRERIAAGAARAGRDPSEINVAEYIRVCVDDDVDAARIALAKATMGYALGPTVPTDRERTLGYRAHFERMGFADELATLDEMRAGGASNDEVAAAFPEEILSSVGYFGNAAGAAAAFKRLSEGLDTAIVRVVTARPGVDATLSVMRACNPAAVQAA
jgi:alkanesulfonate monooxygenase SsuD/methylene tetrahydromethanopterin reductase-like flavin-dependent oxidoreductase (luciferase family)